MSLLKTWTVAAYDRKTEKFLGYRNSDTSWLKPMCVCRADAVRLAKKGNASSNSTFFVAVEQ